MGELLTRTTVWVALTLYVAAETRRRSDRLRRGINTLGCVIFLAHVTCAFHFYHSWSHSAAYADTARQTASLTGWHSGAGLYVNYLFGLVWILEAAWMWTKPNTYVTRSAKVTWFVRAFFWFMIFNGAFVFAHWPMRLYGLLLSLALIVCWSTRRTTITSSS
jgi:hypothetical protein